MKLFVDDVRLPPDNTWYLARSVLEAIAFIQAFHPVEISIDHDLGEYQLDGMNLLDWMEQ